MNSDLNVIKLLLDIYTSRCCHFIVSVSMLAYYYAHSSVIGHRSQHYEHVIVLMGTCVCHGRPSACISHSTKNLSNPAIINTSKKFCTLFLHTWGLYSCC